MRFPVWWRQREALAVAEMTAAQARQRVEELREQVREARTMPHRVNYRGIQQLRFRVPLRLLLELRAAETDLRRAEAREGAGADADDC